MALTREQAWELLNEYNKGEFHLKHGQIVGDVMSGTQMNWATATRPTSGRP